MKNNKGFSLVELIVVIAIMAILAAVAVVGVSVYIPKAQQASDKQMIADIEYVLSLHAQSAPDEVASGYVVLIPDGEAQASDGFVIEVLKATYGDDWAKELKLSYGEWSDDGMLQYVLENSANSKIIVGSSYVQNNTPAQLVDSFGTLADSLSGMAETAGNDPLVTMKTFGVLSDEQVESMRNELGNLNLYWDSSEGADNSAYSTALSNLLIKNVSTELGSTNNSEEEVSGVASMAQMYAAIYGWASTGDPDGKAALNNLNAAIEAPDANTSDIMDAFNAIDTSEGSAFLKYMDSPTAEKDMESLPVIMGAVNDITAGYDVTQKGLFSAESIGGKVDNYFNAITTVSSLDDAQIVALQNAASEGAVVIFITDNGQIITMPAAIRSAK